MAMPQRDDTIEAIKRLDALLEYAVMHNAAGSDPIGGVGSGGVGEICEGHPFFATGETPVVPVCARHIIT